MPEPAAHPPRAAFSGQETCEPPGSLVPRDPQPSLPFPPAPLGGSHRCRGASRGRAVPPLPMMMAQALPSPISFCSATRAGPPGRSPRCSPPAIAAPRRAALPRSAPRRACAAPAEGTLRGAEGRALGLVRGEALAAGSGREGAAPAQPLSRRLPSVTQCGDLKEKAAPTRAGALWAQPAPVRCLPRHR